MQGPRPVPVGLIETDKYYVCGVGRHCLDGNQKLHVRVSNNCGQQHTTMSLPGTLPDNLEYCPRNCRPVRICLDCPDNPGGTNTLRLEFFNVDLNLH